MRVQLVPKRANRKPVERGFYIIVMENLKSLWRGELRLGDAFWNWAVIGALAVNVSTTILRLVLITIDQPWLSLIVGYALSVPYNIVALVGVWRSAAGYDGPALHVDLARWTSLAWLAILSVT